jgi:hypothetical protein
MKFSASLLGGIAGLCVLLASAPVGAVIAEDIEKKTEALKRAAESDAATAEMITDLQNAIKQGEAASSKLWDNIKALEKEKLALQDENRKLERVQTILASGLIGALVTAGVAIFGVLVNVRRSRAERDLKRLEVVEKAGVLQAKGIAIPADIQSEYGVRSSG